MFHSPHAKNAPTLQAPGIYLKGELSSEGGAVPGLTPARSRAAFTRVYRIRLGFPNPAAERTITANPRSFRNTAVKKTAFGDRHT